MFDLQGGEVSIKNWYLARRSARGEKDDVHVITRNSARIYNSSGFTADNNSLDQVGAGITPALGDRGRHSIV